MTAAIRTLQLLFAVAGLLVVGYAGLLANSYYSSVGDAQINIEETCRPGTNETTCEGHGSIRAAAIPDLSEGDAYVVTAIGGLSLIGFAIVLGQLAPVSIQERRRVQQMPPGVQQMPPVGPLRH